MHKYINIYIVKRSKVIGQIIIMYIRIIVFTIFSFMKYDLDFVGLEPVNNNRHKFHLVVYALSSIRK